MTNFERLKAQRNELNNKVKLMREELTQLHEPGSYIGMQGWYRDDDVDDDDDDDDRHNRHDAYQ